MIKYGYKFNTIKEGNEWVVRAEKFGALVTSGKTKKAAIKNANDILSAKGQKVIERTFTALRKKRVHNRFFEYLQPEFKKIFGFTCPVCLTSGLTGRRSIDVISFDKRIGTPNGISTYDYIKKTYGKRAKKILQKLI